MKTEEGHLVFDPTLKRYKIVGLPEKQDHCLQAGEQVELYIDGQWTLVSIGLFGKAQDK